MHPVPKPPRLPAWLLRRLHPEDTLEEVQGDLDELYAHWLAKDGKRRADLRYGLAVLSVLPPLVKRRRPNRDSYPQPSFFQPDMLRNYFTIAWRNLVRHKAYSFINVFGLAVGMAVALLNGLWVWDELSFDQYHENYPHIAQVMKRAVRHGTPYASKSVQYPLADALRADYGDYFAHVVAATEPGECTLLAGETRLSKTGLFIQPGAPDMLTLRMLRGSRAGLRERQSVLLAASTARALFGNDDPLGRFVKINSDMHAKVTGVYEDLPHNTAFHEVQFLAPFDLWVSVNPWVREQGWDNQFLHLYAQVKPGLAVEEVSRRIKDGELNQLRRLPGMEERVARMPELFLLPMPEWHLRGTFKDAVVEEGPVFYVWMIGLIGGFVLLLACINFMNLSTARSEKRAREVGIRKAIGSVRGQLVKQFFSESFLVAGVAFGLALLLAGLALPAFNALSAKQMHMPWFNPYFWSAALLFLLLTGLVAGSYPAFYLSSFRPVQVLKGTFRAGRGAVIPRQVLVVMQFTVSVTLIIGTITVYRQLRHAKDRPVGYAREGLVMVPKKTGAFYGKGELFRSELKRTGVVAEVAESRSSTTRITMMNGGFSYKGRELDMTSACGTLSVTPEYGKTVGWDFVAGRDFVRGLTSDSAGFVVNETFAKRLGLRNPVGETVRWAPDWRKDKNQHFTILGVVKDMVITSPYEPANPTVFFLEDYHNWINIRIRPDVSAAQALPKIAAVFARLTPETPFTYQFADQAYALKFAAEERIGKLAAFFATLAIFISCLGLFGLASFTAEQRTKEIGIRKVMGASVPALWRLLSKDFLVLVLVAFLIAAPVSWYFLSGWLENYAYRTELSWWVFALAGGGALFITLLTVSVQAIKAALQNPVKSLRTE